MPLTKQLKIHERKRERERGREREREIEIEMAPWAIRTQSNRWNNKVILQDASYDICVLVKHLANMLIKPGANLRHHKANFTFSYNLKIFIADS